MSGVMTWLFASGHAADLILGVLAIEAAWLRFGRGWGWGAMAGLLGPAALIVLGAESRAGRCRVVVDCPAAGVYRCRCT